MTQAIHSTITPRAFIWRRIHSLTGLWFLIFLCEHLLTNSQSMMFFTVHAPWFVNSVNFLRNIPYIKAVEITLLGVPILLHAGIGIRLLFTGRLNTTPTDGATPYLRYGRNHAYSWQRVSAVVLLVGLILHVVDMRFLDYPYQYVVNDQNQYYNTYHFDPGLYSVANQLRVQLYDAQGIDYEKQKLRSMREREILLREHLENLEKKAWRLGEENEYQQEINTAYRSLSDYQAQTDHVRGLESRTLKEGYVMGVSPSFGALELLNVRERFQSLSWCVLYTIFVLAAVFHGGNGLWTFLITWGLLLSKKSQSNMVHFCTGLIFLLGVFGMMSIWGTFLLG